MNLVEGNDGDGWASDLVHGSHFTETVFRNAWRGVPTGNFWRSQFIPEPQSRFMNIVGNV